jgi:hypothetical protein
MMPPSRGVELDSKLHEKDAVASLKPTSSTQVTFCSSADSDGCPSRDSTACTSSSEIASRGRGGPVTPTPKNDRARERYFRRLGVSASSIERLDSLNKQGASSASHTSTQYCSVPGRNITGCHADKAMRDRLRRSSSHGDIPASTKESREDCTRQHKIILLRRSVQYTTELKLDPSGGIANSTSEPIVSPSKFDLSSSRMSLLSTDVATTASSSPYDGAFDLFSLPSDSSIAIGRRDSTKSLDTNIVSHEAHSSRDDLSLSSTSKQRRVSFDSMVKATTIPSRCSYSTRIKSRIWSSSEEIHANCFRNVREYEYDGKNWRTAKEEGDFLRCASANELHLVHPVHFCGWPSSLSPWQIEQYAIFNSGLDVSSIPNEVGVDTNQDGIFH